MGNQKQYIENGGFTEYLYQDESPKVTINGVTGKIISNVADPTGMHDGLPTYSNSSDMYFKKGRDGWASQARIYINRKLCLDLDWSHSHRNPDGTVFPKGVIHVQAYQVDSKGNITRLSHQARLMTDAEIIKYGPIIKHFNPNVKFRP